MKTKKTPSPLAVTFTSLLMVASAQAIIVAPIAPSPITTWTPIADTLSSAPQTHAATGTVSTFNRFLPPVIIPGSTLAPQLAFKGWMTLALGVTLALDEGVWSNADASAWSSHLPAAAIWLVAQENDVVAGHLLGNGGSMPVQALQTTIYDGTLFTTTSSATPMLHMSVYEGNGLNGLAGVSVSGFADGGRAVAGSNRIAAWAKDSGGFSGTKFWDVTPAAVHGLTLGNIRWVTTPQPKVQCSPAISEHGAVAHRNRSPLGPVFTRDFIGATPNVSGGSFPAPVTVVRRNELAQVGERFGVFHPNLMAITGGPSVPPTVAWQMNNMYTDLSSPSLLGTPIPSSNSLWCWRSASAAGTQFAQIARVGTAAPDIPGRIIRSFYALHLTDDPLTYPETEVFYGVLLNSNYRAIYTRNIRTVAGVTVLDPEQLIATDDPLGPAALHVPAIHAGVFRIATLFPWFSVDLAGNVLIKATLAAAPAGQSQCLISAMGGLNAHAMSMRAQSHSTVTINTINYGFQPISNMFITNPEQGPLGRGQAIAGTSIGMVVRWPTGNGIFIGN